MASNCNSNNREDEVKHIIIAYSLAFVLVVANAMAWFVIQNVPPEPGRADTSDCRYNVSTLFGTCYKDPATLPCNYLHPEEFTYEQWRDFSARCRR